MVERHPDTHKPIGTAKELDRVANIMARRAAGLPDYAMDDPERPFTEEYDPPREPHNLEPDVPPTSQRVGSLATRGFSTAEPGTVEALQERADRIAQAARLKEASQYDPNKEPSEAARDQGWGPIDRRDLPTASSRPNKTKKIKPYRGKIRGESEGELRDMEAAQARIDAERTKQLTLDT